eukprot:6183385-Pleurochrysis_carterae.AAC.1
MFRLIKQWKVNTRRRASHRVAATLRVAVGKAFRTVEANERAARIARGLRASGGNTERAARAARSLRASVSGGMGSFDSKRASKAAALRARLTRARSRRWGGLGSKRMKVYGSGV